MQMLQVLSVLRGSALSLSSQKCNAAPKFTVCQPRDLQIDALTNLPKSKTQVPDVYKLFDYKVTSFACIGVEYGGLRFSKYIFK